MFNPYKSSLKIKEEFIDYIKTIFPFNDSDFSEQFSQKLNEIIAKGPFLDIKPIFESSLSIDDLIKKGELSQLFYGLEKCKEDSKEIKVFRPLYSHQVDAVRKSKDASIVVTTGTGSGKTECFFIPFLNELLNEKETKGYITNQVKVLIIYPMNALANDQMNKLRKTLKDYPDITFGSYTGETKTNKEDAEKEYRNLHEHDSDEKIKWTKEHCGLKNEIKSREEMWSQPPHILITNYAMLERMLLLPYTDKLFKTADMRYIVLDEAHVYEGTRGIETSLLIRRLLARINSQKTRFLLTSATLGEKGESEEQICDFARNLTSMDFSKESIIYGKRNNIYEPGNRKIYDEEFFINIIDTFDNKKLFENICNKYSIDFDPNIDTAENIYNICYNSIYFDNLYLNLMQKNNLISVACDLEKYLGMKSNDAAMAFVFACTYATKGKKSLLDARYHFFMRALEGCYISFNNDKPNLFLERLKNDNDYKVFELSICRKCGSLSLYGFINEDGYFEQKSFADEKVKMLHLHFANSLQKSDIEDLDDDEISEEDLKTDEEYVDKKGKHKISKFYLCPKCGKICIESDGEPQCDCGIEPFLVYGVNAKYDGCLSCNNGKYSQFYLGNDAATGVICTSLYQELPKKKIKIGEGESKKIVDGGKQFLAFSDNRADAAFFAPYMEKIYEVFLRRRAIYKAISELSIGEKYNLDDFLDNVSKVFKSNHTFKENALLESDYDNEINKQNSIYGLLTELATQNKRNSLSSMGIIAFEYAGLDQLLDLLKKENPGKFNDSYSRELLNELIMTIASWGAVDSDYYKLSDSDREFIFYSSRQKTIVKNKVYTGGLEAALTRNVTSWMPRTLKTDRSKYIKNSRYLIASKLINSEDSMKIKSFLTDVWDKLTLKGKMNPSFQLTKNINNEYYLKTCAFTVKRADSNDTKWYKCIKCGKISKYTLNGICPVSGCFGKAKEINDIKSEFTNNHYRKLYEINAFDKMFIKEHTAQLSTDKSAKYQSQFERNEINALSCSTTFEMGVNLGELENVFLRDVPPNPSNYIQRSGRAGRSTTSCAYTITYAKLSSHDFNYFNNPLDMIKGRIVAPKFKTNNRKVLRRHIYAVVLGHLFNNRILPVKFSDFVQKENLDIIRDYIADNSKFSGLLDIVNRSFDDIDCNESFESQISELVSENGGLTLLFSKFEKVKQDFKYDIEFYENIEKNSTDAIERDRASKKKKKIEWQLNVYLNQDTVDFLSKGNILPKYGFPVDIVTLDTGSNNVTLSRDLSLAISDYAPGEVVIADKQKFISRYIEKHQVSKAEGNYIFCERYFAICPNCQTYNYLEAKPLPDYLHKCSGCCEEIPFNKWQSSIIPMDGFYYDHTKNIDISSIRKPRKIYSSESVYVGNNKAIKQSKYKNGTNEILLKHTENDEIMIVSNNPFYVCDSCGYAYGAFDIIKTNDGKRDDKAERDRSFNKQTINVAAAHKNQRDYDCDCHKFHRHFLTHVYKTDVVQMLFKTANVVDKNTILSVAYALVDAISQKFVIDKSDINSCVKLINGEYSIVLFDNVPGGAGHVKRLLERDGKNLSDIIQIASNKMQSCNCGSSCYNCLRNYENQLYHDDLDRFKVIDFLKDYIGNLEYVEYDENKDFIKKNFDKSTALNTDSFMNIIEKYVKDTSLPKETLDGYNKIMNLLIKNPDVVTPTYANFPICIDGKKYSIIAMWENEKIVLVDEIIVFNKIKDDTIYNVYLVDDISQLVNFIFKIRS